jgi:hypothetical protein
MEKITVPGTMTTAYMAMRLFQPDFEAAVIPFDQIMSAVRSHLRGQADHFPYPCEICRIVCLLQLSNLTSKAQRLEAL